MRRKNRETALTSLWSDLDHASHDGYIEESITLKTQPFIIIIALPRSRGQRQTRNQEIRKVCRTVTCNP
jgi:hypothetical protein